MGKSLAACVVIALIVAGCGGSSGSAPQTLGPSPLPPSPPLGLTVSGHTALSAVGETSQMTAILTMGPGRTSREVTNDVRWSSSDPSVASISSSGVATAVGFGAARIEARYESMTTTIQIGVTPVGTFVVSGEVREPGQGAISGVRVLEPTSGKSTLTNQSGTYTLAGLTSRRLRFEKEGYEPGELEIAADNTGHMRMQRMVRLTAGETAVVPKLTHMDVSYDVGPDRCSPCRLVRIAAPTAGTVRLELTWEPNSGAGLHLWIGGQRFAGDMNARRVAAEAVIGPGEAVVYVGYYRGPIMSGSSIAFTLATTMSR